MRQRVHDMLCSRWLPHRIVEKLQNLYGVSIPVAEVYALAKTIPEVNLLELDPIQQKTREVYVSFDVLAEMGKLLYSIKGKIAELTELVANERAFAEVDMNAMTLASETKTNLELTLWKMLKDYHQMQVALGETQGESLQAAEPSQATTTHTIRELIRETITTIKSPEQKQLPEPSDVIDGEFVDTNVNTNVKELEAVD